MDIIRPATLRGHLRFWWRALNAHRFSTSTQLYQSESALWGSAANQGAAGRSAVELRVKVINEQAELDDSDIDLRRTPGAYALWPARAEKKGTQPAPRRCPGTRFRLTLRAPLEHEEELVQVLRAWVLFGGYGGRTRRGLGSLTAIEPEHWRPREATHDAFEELFGEDIFASPKMPVHDTPVLAGAALYVGREMADAEKAWTTALGWLRDFRQGTTGPKGNRAREPGKGKAQPNRPSISNWPEADKVRQLVKPKPGSSWAHKPRHNATPAWPRAGFGLPIIGQFQQKSRVPGPKRNPEPGPFELRWRDESGLEHDRLASPLIVKALPLANGRFVPCALWLNRAYPKGEVILRGVQGSRLRRADPSLPRNKGQVVLRVVPGSDAPFHRLVAPGDPVCFGALQGKSTLKDAFLDWLSHTKNLTKVAR